MSEIHALSGAYAVDALDDHERELFERHLALCPDCRDEVDSLREAAALLPAVTETTPPPSVRDAVLAGISTVRPLPPVVAPATGRPRLFSPRLLVAAAVLVGGTLAVTQPWQDDAPTPPGDSPADRVILASDAIHSTVPMRGGTATLYHSESLGRAVLVTDGVRDAPDERTYELWLQVDGAMVPAGLFHDGGDREVMVIGDSAPATAAGITVEPEGGSEAPTTEPIALFDLTRTT